MNSAGFLLLLILLGAAWVFFLLPARRRQRAHSAMQESVEVGDEIITAGGLHAVVEETGESELRVRIAPGVVVTLDRRAVAAVAREVEVEVPPDEDRVGEADESGTAGENAPKPR